MTDFRNRIVGYGTKKAIQYKEVEDFPGYVVGSDGSVWTRLERISCQGTKFCISESVMRRLKARKNRTGYHRVVLYDGHVGHAKMIHRLVLRAFVGPCPPGMIACHNDDNRDNNSLCNLRWDTPSANWQDRKANGRHMPLRQEKHPMAKLNCELAEKIREEHIPRKNSYAKLAAKYGVCPGTIKRVVSGKRWARDEKVG